MKKSRWQRETRRNHKDVCNEGKESPTVYYEKYVGEKKGSREWQAEQNRNISRNKHKNTTENMTGTIRHKGDKMIFNISCNKQDQKHKQVGWPGQEEVVRRTE